MIRSNGNQVGVSIDLTPIIDMVFLLLIFFLVATTFHQTEREMQVALPAATSAGPISATLREIIVNVDAEGRIIVNGRTIDAQELRSLIERAVAGNPQQKVTVRGDRRTAYVNVIRVLDVCKGSGVQEPYLDTVPGELE
ncbi:MAG: biopolymer transporter ExbD [Planctomycetes bacterium]|nr:biopolymer transporter ExbD [Planctomycetota bacterium]